MESHEDPLSARRLGKLASIGACESTLADEVRERPARLAVGAPGTDLGATPVPRFDPEPRAIDLDAALAGIDGEVARLRMSFAVLTADGWASTVVLDGVEIDPHWIARHAVHDPTRHLIDIQRLRNAL